MVHNKKEQVNKKKKVVVAESSSSESESESDVDEKMSEQEYRKFLASLFPSKNIAKKIKDGDKLKKKVEKVEEEWETDESEEDEQLSRRKSKRLQKKSPDLGFNDAMTRVC